jgi:hypothetical protein
MALVFLGVWLAAHQNRPNKSGFSGTYDDPYSHQTVSNPAGKTPDTYGASKNQPVYLGFDKLLNYGIDLDQLNSVKLAFYNYSNSLPSPLKEISIDVDHITSRTDLNKNPSFTIDFTVKFDRANDYKVQAGYNGLEDMRVYIKEISGKQVYDSGPLGQQE